MRIILTSMAVLAILSSCKKIEGPGGTSSIYGTVMSQEYDAAQPEITEIIFSNGDQVEHGDYFLLNTIDSNAYYYVWYENPTWTSPGDPNLAGRIGIPVSFNYSDSNEEIALNTETMIDSITGGQFTTELINDILIITNQNYGNVPDADKGTTNFDFNIADQGENSFLGDAIPAVDEKVYIVYGDQEQYNDDVRTDVNGNFRFTGLTNGNYTVYAVSESTISEVAIEVSTTITISEKKSTNDAGTLTILD